MTHRSRRLLWLVLGAFAVLAFLGLDQAQIVTGLGLPERSGQPVLIVAHRGNMAEYPEDTMGAVLDAARLGADGIEIDAHQSADGTWWIMHDATVDRTTDGTGFVADLGDAEIEALVIDGGPGFDAHRDAEVHPPRLEDVLTALADYSGLIIVDLQHATAVDLGDLASLLAGRNAAVIARSAAEVEALHALDAGIATLLRVDRMDPETVVDYAFYEAVSEATVGRVQSESLPVATYRDDRYAHLAEEWVLRRAWAAGVDMYLTKELEAALAYREQLAADGPAR